MRREVKIKGVNNEEIVVINYRTVSKVVKEK